MRESNREAESIYLAPFYQRIFAWQL